MNNEGCILQKNGLCITSNGKANPCCFSGDFLSISSDTNIASMFNSDQWNTMAMGDWKEQDICKYCLYFESDKMSYSRRHQANTMYNDLSNNDIIDTDKKKPIVFLDISFSNLCNQKCIMCNSKHSTRWLTDDLKFNKTNSNLNKDRGILDDIKSQTLSDKQIDQLIDLIDERTHIITLKGGEPTMDSRMIDFISRANKKNPLARIQIITNGSIFNRDLVKSLNSIKNVTMMISIDGVGDTYSFIRDSDWNKTADSFEKYVRTLSSNHSILVLYTLSRYNLDSLKDTQNWLNLLRRKYNRVVNLSITVVTDPKCLQVRYAGEEKLTLAIKHMEEILTDPLVNHTDRSWVNSNKIFLQSCLNNLPTDEEQINADKLSDMLINTRTNTFLERYKGKMLPLSL